MTEETPLDRTHRAMEEAPEDGQARLRFYERLADAELFLLLTEEPPEDDTAAVTPQVFPVGEERYVLAFDREERLAAFAGPAAAYAALPGRALAGMLAGERLGLGLNLEVAPSSVLLPGSAMEWLNGMLRQRPDEITSRPAQVEPPRNLPPVLLEGLDTKLALAGGLAQSAYLVAVEYEGGGRGHMLGFVGALPGAETALTDAVAEALVFSGVETGVLDVAFFAAADPICARLARVGLRFDVPQEEERLPRPARAPGTDPAHPPRLK